MLGLKSGMVELLEHCESWKINAQNEIVCLKGILGEHAIDIQHVGSTSICGIHAKPIIDIAVGVSDFGNAEMFIQLLSKHGYVYAEEDTPGKMLFLKCEGEKKTHHIHFVKHGGREWNDYVNFRDYLNAQPEKAMQYDALKVRLCQQFSQERARYTAGKHALISQLLDEACLWRIKCS